MQKILTAIIMLMMSATIAQAQTHNPVEGDDATMSVKVIKPLTVENVQEQQPDILPDVIKGQVRELTPQDNSYWIFRVEREAQYHIKFNLTLPNPIDGVELDGFWGYETSPPQWGETGQYPNRGLWTNWEWTPSELEEFYIILFFTEIDASQAQTTGARTFTATCSAWYHNL